MAFSAMLKIAEPSPDPLDPVENSEGNTFDLRSLGALSPLSASQDSLDMETS